VTDEATPALSIGAMVGGTTASPQKWKESVMALARQILVMIL
jgi:hypothetical protein